jgi:DNA-binding NarL/FixJ family response regulator
MILVISSGANMPHNTPTLTEREQDVLRLLATGATNRQIAQELYIGKETVKTHVSNILRKFGAASRTEAVGLSYTWGLLTVEQEA